MKYCECGCGRSLEGRRKDCRFYSDQCRIEAWRREHPERLVTASVQPQAPSGNGTEPRRATRDGQGTKVYLLPTELAELEMGPPYPPRILQKLRGARDRIQQKENL